MDKKWLNIINPYDFENEVNEQPIMSSLDVKEILKKFLVELSKKVNIANKISQ